MNSIQISGEDLLHQWMVSLKTKDRKKGSLITNFDELVSSFKSFDISYDKAKDLMGKAIKAHLPSEKIAEATYNKYKFNIKQSKKEYLESWFKNIEEAGWGVFYNYYSLINKENQTDLNGISKEEYLRQRKYAESFPILDTSLNKVVIMEIPDYIKVMLNDYIK